MKLQILSLLLLLSILGCSKQTQPSLEIQLFDADAGGSNGYLNGSILFHGLSTFDFANNGYGIRLRYFYVEDDDGHPRINQFSDEWRNVSRNYDTYTVNLNKQCVVPLKKDEKQNANLMIMASICESDNSNELFRVWCKKKINWKQYTSQ